MLLFPLCPLPLSLCCRALVFTQTQQMLDIIERHAGAEGYTYHRMDGSTSVAQRARLIDDFNDNPDGAVVRVGGGGGGGGGGVGVAWVLVGMGVGIKWSAQRAGKACGQR